MKNYLIFTLITLSLFIIFSCTTSIDDDKDKGNILIVQGHFTYKGENFTGTYIKKWPKEYTKGDHILCKYKFKNGLPDGLQEIYYMDGKLFRTFDNFDGKKGNCIKYNEDGTIWAEVRGSWIGFMWDGIEVRGIPNEWDKLRDQIRKSYQN